MIRRLTRSVIESLVDIVILGSFCHERVEPRNYPARMRRIPPPPAHFIGSGARICAESQQSPAV
jgi:hypothetical protein